MIQRFIWTPVNVSSISVLLPVYYIDTYISALFTELLCLRAGGDLRDALSHDTTGDLSWYK